MKLIRVLFTYVVFYFVGWSVGHCLCECVYLIPLLSHISIFIFRVCFVYPMRMWKRKIWIIITGRNHFSFIVKHVSTRVWFKSNDWKCNSLIFHDKLFLYVLFLTNVLGMYLYRVHCCHSDGRLNVLFEMKAVWLDEDFVTLSWIWGDFCPLDVPRFFKKLILFTNISK